jgi:surface antigen
MTLVAGVSGSTARTWTLSDQYSSQIAQDQAKIAQDQAQQPGVNGQVDAQTAAANATEQQLAQTQAELISAQQAVDKINLELAQTNAQLTKTRAKLTKDRQSLAQMTVNTYEEEAQGFTLNAVVNSTSLSDAINNVAGLQHVNASISLLTGSVQHDQDQLTSLLAQQTSEEAAAQSKLNQITALHAQYNAQYAQEQAQLSNLKGQAGSLQTDINNLTADIGAQRQKQAEVAAAAQAARSGGGGGGIVTGNAIPPFGFGFRTDDFPWGQCTWYVASLRDVPWTGDASAWAGNAAAMGFTVGSSPRVGSIVVWGAGRGYSGFGHVAYVVSVSGPSSFVVDEANYMGLGVIDQRVVMTLSDVEGFVY